MLQPELPSAVDLSSISWDFTSGRQLLSDLKSNTCAAKGYLFFPRASRTGEGLPHQAETSVSDDTSLVGDHGIKGWKRGFSARNSTEELEQEMGN
jgi:hypothetical protein